MQYKDCNSAYQGTLKDLLENGIECCPRGQPTKELPNYMFSVEHPTSLPILTADDERNDAIRSYTAKEFDLYLKGTNSAADFSSISKMWGRLANPDGTTNSAYGWLIWKDASCGNPTMERAAGNTGLMLTPWEWALRALQRDKDSRQAIVKFHKRSQMWDGNKDFTCTMHVNFSIRNDRLNTTTVMRSNDLFYGLVFDMPFFAYLAKRMVVELSLYPNLQVGTYTHFAHSMHYYLKDEDAIRRMIFK